MELVQYLASGSFDLTLLGDGTSHLLGLMHWDWDSVSPVLAQQFNTDVFAATRAWFDNFLKSGQVWALIVGFVMGYVIKSLASYG
ncbi:MAG: hypothetical protein MUF49_01975 [Oculatellaceae cyanobacterium Prado106]|nr:hypothetical protein [Oculatellaceae cyanobacterium Prado106]